MFEFLLTQILKSQCLLIKTAWLQQMRSGWSGQEGGEQVEAERVGVIGTEKRAPSLSSTSTCWGNSFLIRVTGLLLTTWGRETRRENSFPYYQSIAARVSPAWSRFVVGKVVSQPRFFFFSSFKHINQAEQASEWRADCTERTAALTAWAAWQHAWVRSHVWVWTWAERMCYTERVPSAPPAAETLKDRACQRNDVVGASTFCCSFTPATTGMLQTVEAPAPSEEELAGLMQADKRSKETRRRELRYEPRGFVCLRLKVIMPLIQQQNFTENSLAPNHSGICHKCRLPSLTYSPTHKQGREINNLDRVSNR